MIAIPGMDSYKEIQVALYGDKYLSRGLAVLAIDGPGQYEAPMIGLYFTMENWMAAGPALLDWIAARPELDATRVGAAGTSFGSLFGTVLTANEPRIKACAVMSVCHEPGCHTIFQEASPTFKKRFMYMSGITDEDEFDEFRKKITWQGHAEKIRVPYLCVAGEAEELSPAGTLRAADGDAQGAEADGGVSGIAPFGRQRSSGQSRAVPADPDWPIGSPIGSSASRSSANGGTSPAPARSTRRPIDFWTTIAWKSDKLRHCCRSTGAGSRANRIAHD